MTTEILTRLSASITESRGRAKKEAKDGFAAAFRDFFKRFPEVKSICWTQGTPSFNDGDPCYFSRHEMDFSLDAKVRPFVEGGLPLEDAIAAAQAGILAPEAAGDEDEDEDEEDEYEDGDTNIIGTFPNPNYAEEKNAYEAAQQHNRSLTWNHPDYKRVSYPQARVDCKPQSERETALMEAFKEFTSLEEDLFEYAFGDGVKVTATSKGLSIEEHYSEY